MRLCILKTTIIRKADHSDAQTIVRISVNSIKKIIPH